jgi:hypothetical protein
MKARIIVIATLGMIVGLSHLFWGSSFLGHGVSFCINQEPGTLNEESKAIKPVLNPWPARSTFKET